jgi:rhodanese-related sulfurtransferase
MTMTHVSSELPAAIGPRDAAELLRAGDAKLLDVRSPAEFESAHIPGSYNVPLDQLPEHGAELRDLQQPVVLICRSGNRARQAEMLLRESGLPLVHVLEGGLEAWQSTGLDVRRGRQMWSLERQVRAIAGGLVLLTTLGGLLVWQPLILLATFVGAGLLFAGVTDTCLMGMLLLKLPYNQGASCDISAVVSELKASSAAGAARGGSA